MRVWVGTARPVCVALTLAASFAVSGPAIADEDENGPKGPRLEGEIVIEFQSDNTFSSDDKDSEISDTYNKTEAEFGFYFTDALSIQTGLVFEPVLDPDGDRLFGDQGLFVEQLYGQIDLETFKVFAGKFNPGFGKGYDVTPGIYGTDFAEEYELTEKVGFGASVKAAAPSLATFELTGTLFQADTSGLSNSAFTSRGQTSEADGGPDNTNSLESYTVVLDVSDIAALPGISAQAGYRYRAEGLTDDDLSAEDGFVFGLYGEHEWNSVKFSWIGEAVYLDGFGGIDAERWFYTIGGEVRSNKWFASAAATLAPLEVAGEEDFEDDKQITFTVGREIRDDWELGVGYKYVVEEDIESHVAGIQLAKSISFNNGNAGLK